ncbi:TPA: hypothetical protein VDT85_006068 [Pseudomonas aeruginosa]|uniref:hypothetical protein n=1 Tax=Pseudomonas TaxID=286 RepID=UPI0005BC6B53|nr:MULTISPECIES: hypothetical protein [Pseudomonas]ELM7155057.1 hypothetical protein [Pseudomonas aeruginosa]MBI7363593.1 hypothetical protein [Pseudomonas aeruginosa]MDH0293460.1 hypothetical protein [Pseudomonas sp. GD04087]MDH1053044.1 hypothetical protein [Pseudomonas sp. GD03903]MDH2003694.1 hypothetical protein [Pseudomonas sp. GD03691]
MLLSLIGLIACAVACWRACRRDADEQAALLPFADDPEAARRMSAATGRHCERIVQPLPEPPPPYRMRA